MRADVGIADRLRVDDASDDERGARERTPGRCSCATDERIDARSRASLDDLRPSRDLAPIGHLDTEAVVVRLLGFGRFRIAQLDDRARHRGRPRARTVNHDGDRVAGFHAKAGNESGRSALGAKAAHFIKSLTVSYGSALSAKL